MSRARSWIFGLVIFIVVAAIGLLVVRRLLTADEEATLPAGRGPAPVEVAAVEHGPIEDRRIFSGTLEATARVTVAPKIAGGVVSLRVDLADRIERGQVVAELDAGEYEQAEMQAQAELAVAKANLGEAESASEIAARELDRARTLTERGVASEAQLDTAIAANASKSAAVEVAKAEVAREEAALATARIRLGYTVIEASWTGGDDERVVAERFADEGDTVAANTPLVSIIELDPIRGVVHVTERDYALLAPGQSVTLRTDAFPSREWSAEVSRVSPVFREGSRQARVEISAPNEQGLLKPGMFVRVEAVLSRVEDATIVPLSAITQRQGKPVVFVVDDARRSVRMVPVEIGIRTAEHVQLIGADVVGEVVTLGQQLIDDGSAITIPQAEREGQPAAPAASPASNESERGEA